MKKKILLYNPPATTNEKFWVRPMPLNLLSICSLLDENKVSIVISQSFPEEIFKEFKPFIENAVCLGISCMTGVQIKYGLSLAKKIKKIKPTLPIIWGGYHISALPDQTLKNKYVDVVVKGYGEITFSELVEKLLQGKSYENVEGIAFKRNNEIIHTSEREMPKLDELPPIPYHLFDVEKFFKKTGTRTLHYISSRGCPHKCGFCADFVIYKQRWNALSAERVLDDLIRLKKIYNYDTVRFYDSNLFVNEKRINSICEGIIEAKLSFNWSKCNGDAAILSRYSNKTLQLMRKAGVKNVLLGVESGYGPALKCVNKAANMEDNLKTIKKLHTNDISIGFSLIFGFPYDLDKDELAIEHRRELEATMKLISEFSKDYITSDYYLVFVFTPYPGVELYERYVKLGFVPPESFEQWGPIDLNEVNSSLWIAPHLLKLYFDSLRTNWFLMHKLRTAMARNILTRPFAKFCDKLVCKIIYNRLNLGKLHLPLILRYLHKFFPIIQYRILDRFINKLPFSIKYK